MNAIFLSDAHLRSPQDKNYQLLLKFLDQQKDLDHLFLLGDIFEFWLGYRHVVFSAYVPLLEKLRQLKNQGTKLYFVEGNHDFNMGSYFAEELKCTVIPDQQLVKIDNQSIFICHGDLLKADRGYRLLRSFWRSRPARALAHIIHPDLVWTFALWLSNKSSKNKPNRVHRDPSPYLAELSQSALIGNAQAIVCGHYHYPVASQYNGIQLLALGDWISQFSYAQFEHGELTLKHYQG